MVDSLMFIHTSASFIRSSYMDRILSDISHMLSKLINTQVAKMYGNNGTFYEDTKI